VAIKITLIRFSHEQIEGVSAFDINRVSGAQEPCGVMRLLKQAPTPPMRRAMSTATARHASTIATTATS
jgi:hypothetical protein